VTARILDGRAIAAQIRSEVAERVRALAERAVMPGLAAVLVGDDEASRIYVGAKHKASADVGIRPEQVELPAYVTEGELLATIQNPQLAELLERIFGTDSPVWNRFRVAPAAKYYHQAYTHGLLDHTVSVAQAVSAAAAAFPGIDRDVAVAGALLHDIGKTQAYNDDPLAIDLTDAGRLQGEIPLGYYLVRRTIESIAGFETELAQAVLHIVLSHHGTYENGSPVIPATREATLVHAMDNLGGRLGSFDRIERELPEGEAWSRFDRGLDSAAYFRSNAA